MSAEIFVFGSNLAGIHGAGAARYAFEHHGAQMGVGVGRTGNSYAIPTKDAYIRTLPLEFIKKHVEAFLIHASWNKDDVFKVTRIGCGLAGYSDSDIAPMFRGAAINCIMPAEWDFYLHA